MFKKRADAIIVGDMYYHTGKQCKHGHISKRLTSDGSCYECRMITNKNERIKIKEIRESVGSR